MSKFAIGRTCLLFAPQSPFHPTSLCATNFHHPTLPPLFEIPSIECCQPRCLRSWMIEPPATHAHWSVGRGLPRLSLLSDLGPWNPTVKLWFRFRTYRLGFEATQCGCPGIQAIFTEEGPIGYRFSGMTISISSSRSISLSLVDYPHRILSALTSTKPSADSTITRQSDGGSNGGSNVSYEWM